VRKVFDVEKGGLSQHHDELGMTLGEALLTPTKIYVKPVLAVMEELTVKSVSHITGGGFYENIPRALPNGKRAKIERAAVEVLPIFDLIQKTGGIPEHDMFNTFNMGVGMILAVGGEDADRAVAILNAHGERAKVIGQIENGEKGIELC
jgi:phosphoribosylformylglycinamidine cyclo-ligase